MSIRRIADKNETRLVDKGIDFVKNEMFIRWDCERCGYYVYGKADGEPPNMSYCLRCGRKVKNADQRKMLVMR